MRGTITLVELRGKTILLTGGRRVGQVVAEELARAGANMALTYRQSQDEITAAVQQLAGAHNVRAAAYKLDLTNEGSIRACLKSATADFRGLDGLVNMAAVFDPDPKEIGVSHVLQAFSVSIGSILLSRWFVEEAKRRRAHNVPIVSFIDWAVDHPYANYDLYLASKAALRHYLMALQTTFAGTVRVVNIHPGMILEPPGFPSQERQEILANTPTKSVGDPAQAAKLVRLALESDFLADNVFLDGGQHWRQRL